jgi:phosphoribosylglycinamide formyltransferase-1
LVILGGFLSLLNIPADTGASAQFTRQSAFCGEGYYGSKVHKAVLDAGVKVSGCTSISPTMRTTPGRSSCSAACRVG